MPLNYRHDDRPDAPTRLAEKKRDRGDRFETLIYHLSEPDLFLTLDMLGTPSGNDWVVTEIDNDSIIIELYDDQDFLGIANFLSYYKLQNSEQWRPQIRDHFDNW